MYFFLQRKGFPRNSQGACGHAQLHSGDPVTQFHLWSDDEMLLVIELGALPIPWSLSCLSGLQVFREHFLSALSILSIVCFWVCFQPFLYALPYSFPYSHLATVTNSPALIAPKTHPLILPEATSPHIRVLQSWFPLEALIIPVPCLSPSLWCLWAALDMSWLVDTT